MADVVSCSQQEHETFPFVVRRFFPFTSKRIKTIEKDGGIAAFGAQLGTSLKRAAFETSIVLDSVQVVLHCVRNIHEQQKKAMSKSSMKLCCYFITLLKDCVGMLRKDDKLGNHCESEKPNERILVQHSGKDVDDEICCLIIDFPIFKTWFLDEDCKEISCALTELFERILESAVPVEVRTKFESYYEILSGKILSLGSGEVGLSSSDDCPMLTDDGSVSSDTACVSESNAAEVLNALKCLSALMPFEKCDALISRIITSLAHVRINGSSDWRMSTLLTCLKMLLSRKENPGMFSTSNNQLTMVTDGTSQGRENSLVSNGPAHHRTTLSNGSFHNKQTVSNSVRIGVSVGSVDHLKHKSTGLRNEHIQGLFSLLVKHRFDVLDDLVLSLLEKCSSIAVLAPIAVTDLCLKIKSPCLLEIAKRLVQASPLHALHVVNTLCARAGSKQHFLLDVMPVIHALLFTDNAEIKHRLGKYIDLYIYRLW